MRMEYNSCLMFCHFDLMMKFYITKYCIFTKPPGKIWSNQR